MLQAIRDRVTGLVAIFVLGLLAIPFLFFGLDSYIQSVPQDAVATVGDDKITSSEFQTSFAQYRANLRERQGDAYDEIASNQPIARREHLEGMIDQLLLRQHAEQMGLTVSEQAMLDVIRDIPGFQVNGRFDPEQYRLMLQSAGRTPRGFEQELRDDLLVNVLPSSLTSSIVATEAEIDQLIELQQQTRQVALIEISPEAFEDQVEVTTEDVETFYADNQDQFMTIEQVRVSWIELNAEDLREGLTLDEEELRVRYEAAQQRYLTPEAREASHILIVADDDRNREQAEALAAEIRQRLLDGEDFAELAETYSDDPGSSSEGGSLGLVEPGQMVEPFEEALYALETVGDLSDVVESRFGWHIIRLDDVRPPQGMSFEQARDEILTEYVEIESETLFIEQSERLVDMVFADDSTLTPVADELGLEIQTSEPFSRMGGEGVLSNPQVVEAAFSDLVLLDGAVSDPIDVGENHLVVIKLEEHLPAEVKPFDEVADSIRERLMLERAADLARDQAEALAATLRDDESATLESVAAEQELEVQVIDALERYSFEHGGDFVQSVFRLPAPGNEPSVHVLDKGRNFAVVRLDSVTPGNPGEASEAERASARQQLRFARSDYEIAGLVEYLRDNTEISVVEERL